MAWTIHLRGKAIAALTDATDRTWIPVADVAAALGLRVQIDQPAAAIYLHDPDPLPTLPADPVGANVQPWNPVTAPIQSRPGERSPELLGLVIGQFRVATNPRYAPGHQGRGETYCNIYVWDVTRALNAEIPYYLDAAGKPTRRGAFGAMETDANGMIRWLHRHGGRFGWTETDAVGAMAEANTGRPAIVTWFADATPWIGHMAVVRPGVPDPQRGAAIAQAGAKNFDDGYLTDGFGGRGPLGWWVHD